MRTKRASVTAVAHFMWSGCEMRWRRQQPNADWTLAATWNRTFPLPPTTHVPYPSMASTMLRRQLCSCYPKIFKRSLASTSALRQLSPAQKGAQTTGAKNIFDTHTVEDLQGMHASDILAETGSRKEAKIRHFTGTSPHPTNSMSMQLLTRSPVLQ